MFSWIGLLSISFHRHSGSVSMAEQNGNETLYQQALSAALGELYSLNTEIDHLHTQLDRLERQKAAVESICQAIGQWVETQEPQAEEEILLQSPVALTEEEVSLIAYPSQMPNEA